MDDVLKPSDRVRLVRSFQYRGVWVFVRKFYNIYDFVLTINNKIFWQYYDITKEKNIQKKSDKHLKISPEQENFTVGNLCTIAVNTIDREKRSSWIRLKEKIQITLNNYVKHFRKRITEQKESAA